mmetsp:Transcript_48457/g.90826  ORF Transcript_48457/g.90826 Transcript_48457/m.90826 type:complete len:322 (-) Transcript_48457:163-1128(-)
MGFGFSDDELNRKIDGFCGLEDCKECGSMTYSVTSTIELSCQKDKRKTIRKAVIEEDQSMEERRESVQKCAPKEELEALKNATREADEDWESERSTVPPAERKALEECTRKGATRSHDEIEAESKNAKNKRRWDRRKISEAKRAEEKWRERLKNPSEDHNLTRWERNKLRMRKKVEEDKRERYKRTREAWCANLTETLAKMGYECHIFAQSNIMGHILNKDASKLCDFRRWLELRANMTGAADGAFLQRTRRGGKGAAKRRKHRTNRRHEEWLEELEHEVDLREKGVTCDDAYRLCDQHDFECGANSPVEKYMSTCAPIAS